MNIDTAYRDRQDVINNLPAVYVQAEPEVVSCNSAAPYQGQARESTLMLESRERSDDSRVGRQSNLSGGLIEGNEVPKADACPPTQTLPDTWESIEAQLDHWADMDAFYWTQRKEKEYAAWMERTYGLPTT